VNVSIPLLMLMAIVVYVAYRHMGLRAWHALACLVLGFLLSSTAAAPEIDKLLTGAVQWTQSVMFKGKQ
jgi:hypothetical protein